jgi:hypothetical protein
VTTPKVRVTRTAWLLAALAVALRLAVFACGPAFDINRAFYPDSTRYVVLADQLAAHGLFSHPLDTGGVILKPLAELRIERGEMEPSDRRGLQPEILRTPGYPALLAALHWTSRPLHALLILQCLLSGAMVLLVFDLSLQLTQSPRVATLAALILALSPGDIVAACSVLTETAFAFLFLLSVWLAVRWRPRFVAGGMGGFLLGIATLVRPVGMLLAPALSMWMLATNRSWKSLAAAAIVSLASFVPVGLWMVRNHAVGYGYQLSCVGPFNNYFKNLAYMRMLRAGQDYERDWPAVADQLFVELRANLHPGEDSFHAMNRLFRAQLQRDPMAYATVHADSAIRLFTDHSVMALFAKFGLVYQPAGLRAAILGGGAFHWPTGVNGLGLALGLAWFAFNSLIALLMVLGLLILLLRRRHAASLLLAGLILYFVLVTQIHGAERLRVPFMGIQAIAAAAVLAPRRSP